MLCASDDERETDDSRNFTFFSCRIISIFSWCSFIRIATFMRNIFSHVQLHFIQTLYTRQNKKITCLSIPLIRTCTCRIPKGDNNFNKKKKRKERKKKSIWKIGQPTTDYLVIIGFADLQENGCIRVVN